MDETQISHTRVYFCFAQQRTGTPVVRSAFVTLDGALQLQRYGTTLVGMPNMEAAGLPSEVHSKTLSVFAELLSDSGDYLRLHVRAKNSTPEFEFDVQSDISLRACASCESWETIFHALKEHVEQEGSLPDTIHSGCRGGYLDVLPLTVKPAGQR